MHELHPYMMFSITHFVSLTSENFRYIFVLKYFHFIKLFHLHVKQYS
jgi:hypothetical protein